MEYENQFVGKKPYNVKSLRVISPASFSMNINDIWYN